MFLRKLAALLAPLALLAVVCLLLPLFPAVAFWTPVGRGALIGLALGLLLPAIGAARKKEPFGVLLWFPALIAIAALVCQYLMMNGTRIDALRLIATRDEHILLTEAAFTVYMIAQAIRCGN